ncbi:DUF3499 domain-containing protein [Glutamicibacter sp. MNS18]|uniref:DUF3499 domain-containing protein n=1 Tax=Glutamicibacter sp. MNS18 TaxID=2989817 RepID=UPI0022362CDE|nr:DUF3499 domain-containing protein [Glutamicibacter sp. MNS18]MCW4465104.1 DUF3499 domain-containing protein [Glutamicibacter sp. MNS18]
MEALRLCSRPACREQARATLTYVYADSTAVLGPLATYPEPHCYDLCARHADGLTVPSGWSLIRQQLPKSLEQAGEATDELYALAHAVKEQRDPVPEPGSTQRSSRGPRLDTRPRLSVLPSEDELPGR